MHRLKASPDSLPTTDDTGEFFGHESRQSTVPLRPADEAESVQSGAEIDEQCSTSLT